MTERTLKSEPKDDGYNSVRAKPFNKHSDNFIELKNINSPILQRKASCACGGGCPSCQAQTSNASNFTVSNPGDYHEREADRIATQVMEMPAAQTASPVVSRSPSAVQRKCADCNTINEDEYKNLQRKETANNAPTVSVKTSAQISSLQSGGESLPKHLREFFEPRLGYDFSSVRVHTGAKAAESAKEVNALAYTVGRDVVFGQGQYRPETTDGKKLLAHELVHTVQQASSSNETAPKIQRSIDTEISNPGGESIQEPITDEFPESGEESVSEVVADKDSETTDNSQAQSQTPSSDTQTLCFAISELTPNPAARLFGSVAELIVNRDYCSVIGCSPFLVPRSSGTDYFDNILGATFYIAFLGAHNSLSLLQLTELAILSQISLNRPDILAHKSDRKDFYEIKPNSVTGRAAGRLKLRNLAGFFSSFSLPYVAGNAYTPTSEILLASGMVGSFPLEIFLRLQRNRDGLIVYDICARGNLLGIGLSVVISILIALIIIILGGKIDFPLPIPQPALGLGSPDETPVPDTGPVPEAPA